MKENMERAYTPSINRSFYARSTAKPTIKYSSTTPNLPKLTHKKPDTLEKILGSYIACNTSIQNVEIQPSSLTTSKTYMHNSRVQFYKISK